MTQTSVDVVVVGGGASGALAAVAARRAGRSVLLVHKGGGATQQSCGAVDVAEHHGGLGLGPFRSAFSPGVPYLEAANHLAATNRHHPYARIKGCVDCIPEALRFLTEVARGVELRSSRVAGQNLVLASALGTVKRTALAQATMVEGDLATNQGEGLSPRHVGVLHVPALPAADGRHVVATLRYLGLLGTGPGGGLPTFHAVEAVHFRRRRDPVRPHRELATGLDTMEGARAVADALQAAMKDGPSVDRLLVPPLMGMQTSHELIRKIGERIGIPAAELLALPPSVPGERLQRALEQGLADAGVDVVDGEAVNVLHEHGRMRAVTVSLAAGGQPHHINLKSLVLCTGKYLAGGIRREKRFTEPLLDLPVFLDGQLAKEGYVGEYVGEYPEDPQPFLRAGLLTNERLQPLDAEAHQPVFANVFAAGSVLGGYDATRERCGLGVAAVTGMLAGRWAAAAA